MIASEGLGGLLGTGNLPAHFFRGRKNSGIGGFSFGELLKVLRSFAQVGNGLVQSPGKSTGSFANEILQHFTSLLNLRLGCGLTSRQAIHCTWIGVGVIAGRVVDAILLLRQTSEVFAGCLSLLCRAQFAEHSVDFLEFPSQPSRLSGEGLGFGQSAGIREVFRVVPRLFEGGTPGMTHRARQLGQVRRFASGCGDLHGLLQTLFHAFKLCFGFGQRR